MTQAPVIWTWERASEEGGFESLTEVQLCDAAHIYGCHKASGRDNTCAS